MTTPTTSLRERHIEALEHLRDKADAYDETTNRDALAEAIEAMQSAPASPPALEGMDAEINDVLTVLDGWGLVLRDHVGKKPALTIADVAALIRRLAASPAAPAQPEGGAVDIRLWDSQWVNVVNHDNCYACYTTEEAVAKAVRLTEKYMRENITRGFPPTRPVAAQQAVMNGWQPIDSQTLPAGRYLVCSPTDQVREAKWMPRAKRWVFPSAASAFRPTLWRPLPAPPAQPPEAQEQPR